MIHTSNLSIAHFSHPCEMTPERSRLGHAMYIVAYTLRRDTVCYGRKPRQLMQEIAVLIVPPIGNPGLQLSLYFVSILLGTLAMVVRSTHSTLSEASLRS